MNKKGEGLTLHRTRQKKKQQYCSRVIKKHTAKETIQILTGATVGSSAASFAAV